MSPLGGERLAFTTNFCTAVFALDLEHDCVAAWPVPSNATIESLRYSLRGMIPDGTDGVAFASERGELFRLYE